MEPLVILSALQEQQKQTDAYWKNLEQERAKYWLSVIISLSDKEGRERALQTFLARYEFAEKH